MWQRKLIETDRGLFEVLVAGEGPPLCVTHLYSEFNERGNYFADMFVDYFKVYLVNLKGAGQSSPALEDMDLSMGESVKDLEALRKALGYEEWSFAGHSTGGMLGLVYAARFSDYLKKVMVGGAAASGEYMNHEDSIYSRNNPLNARLRELLSIIKSGDSSREDRAKAGREWTEMSLYQPQRFEEYFAKPSSGKVVQTRLDYYSYKELPTYDIRKELGNIKVPTFVYCGRYDSQCPLEFSQEISNFISSSKLYIFDESNHSPFLEEREVFGKMVGDFYYN